jgi:hypothetical protein
MLAPTDVCCQKEKDFGDVSYLPNISTRNLDLKKERLGAGS